MLSKLTQEEKDKYYCIIPYNGFFFFSYKILKCMSLGMEVSANPDTCKMFQNIVEQHGFEFNKEGLKGICSLLEGKIDERYGDKNILIRMLLTYDQYIYKDLLCT